MNSQPICYWTHHKFYMHASKECILLIKAASVVSHCFKKCLLNGSWYTKYVPRLLNGLRECGWARVCDNLNVWLYSTGVYIPPKIYSKNWSHIYHTRPKMCQISLNGVTETIDFLVPLLAMFSKVLFWGVGGTNGLCDRICLSCDRVIWWYAISHLHGSLARYVKLRVAQAPGMPGTFSPPPTSKETEPLPEPVMEYC